LSSVVERLGRSARSYSLQCLRFPNLIDRIEIGSQEVVDGQRQQEIRIVWRFAEEIE
jgi:hypothetical protein